MKALFLALAALLIFTLGCTNETQKRPESSVPVLWGPTVDGLQFRVTPKAPLVPPSEFTFFNCEVQNVTDTSKYVPVDAIGFFEAHIVHGGMTQIVSAGGAADVYSATPAPLKNIAPAARSTLDAPLQIPVLRESGTYEITFIYKGKNTWRTNTVKLEVKK